jgi:RNA polymerase sigma-70 factor (ECF subfamily)
LSVVFAYDDKSLLYQIRDGSIKAFEILYNKYSRRLYFFILSYAKSHADTEEIVQSSFISVWENRHRLDESCQLKNYLYTIAVNKVLNYLKHQAIHQSYIEYSLIHKIILDDQTEKEVLYNELQENVDRVLEILPDQQKNIFRMSRLEGFTNKEIALKLGLSVRTVENQIYRALQYIRLKLAGKYS